MKLSKRFKAAMLIALCASFLFAQFPSIRAQVTPVSTHSKEDVTILDSEWAKVTSPTIEYISDSSKGAQIFNELVPDVESYIHDICQTVAKFLYKTPEEVPAFDKVTLKIYDFDGVAWKAGGPPHIEVGVSSRYLESYASAGNDMSEEVKGVLLHELTHGYQHSSGQDISAIEGTADLVRYLSGYIPLYKRSPGGHYTDSYNKTAFFFDWVRAIYKDKFDFLYELNQTAHPNNGGTWSFEDAFLQVTGRSVDELWNEYQKELIEKGMVCRTSTELDPNALSVEPGNLLKDKKASANQEVNDQEAAGMAIDGKVAGINNGNTKWCSTTKGDKWLQVDLDATYTINRWVVKHAGSGGENALWNTKDFKLQKSLDGKSWTDVDTVINNASNVTDRKVEPFEARYVRLYITTPTNDPNNIAARIYEFELY